MPFKPDDIKKATAYKSVKSIYLTQDLIDRIEMLVARHGGSFNSVVVSMIEHCLADLEQQEQE